MEFAQLHPPGPPVEPEAVYTGLALEARAPADRPYVVANFVSSSDGKATVHGRSGPLGGSDGDRASFHLLRTQVDAVLAGTETMRIENYGRLARDTRFEEIRVAEGREQQPLGVLISRSGRIPFGIRLFADRGSRVAVYAPAGTAVPVECEADVLLHELPDDSGGDLPGVVGSLRRDHGVRSLLLEGGPLLFGAMLAAGLVDELFLTLAPAIAGGAERGVTAGAALPEALELELVWALQRGGHLFLRYVRR